MLMRLFTGIWLIALATISLAPIKLKFELHTLGRMHYLGHWLIFLITAMLFCWGASGTVVKLRRCLGAVCLGILLEWLERVIYHNAYEWKDVLTDSAGVLAALVLMLGVSLLGYSNGTDRTA